MSIRAFLFAAAYTGALATTSAAEPIEETENSSAWQLIVEPKYMRSDVTFPIPGSEFTVATLALVKGDEVLPLQKRTVEAGTMDIQSIRRLAAQSASAELAKLEPRFVRDEAGVIVFAILESDSPVVGSTVFAPDFVEKFRNTLGPDLLVAIPNRFRVYVFPELASRFNQTADLVLQDYERTGFRSSKEVFRVENGWLRAVGVFEDQ